MIEFVREILVTKQYKASPKKFVKQDLKEVKRYEDEYDFYVSSQVSYGMLVRVFSLPVSKFKEDVRYFDNDKQIEKHLIEVLTEVFGD